MGAVAQESVACRRYAVSRAFAIEGHAEFTAEPLHANHHLAGNPARHRAYPLHVQIRSLEGEVRGAQGQSIGVAGNLLYRFQQELIDRFVRGGLCLAQAVGHAQSVRPVVQVCALKALRVET